MQRSAGYKTGDCLGRWLPTPPRSTHFLDSVSVCLLIGHRLSYIHLGLRRRIVALPSLCVGVSIRINLTRQTRGGEGQGIVSFKDLGSGRCGSTGQPGRKMIRGKMWRLPHPELAHILLLPSCHDFAPRPPVPPHPPHAMALACLDAFTLAPSVTALNTTGVTLLISPSSRKGLGGGSPH